MVSVERMIGYGKLESEGELETAIEDKGLHILGWPEKGAIKLHHVNFKYAIEYSYVLKSISFKIDSCEEAIHLYSHNKDFYIISYLNRLALWVGLELACLLCCQHFSD